MGKSRDQRQVAPEARQFNEKDNLLRHNGEMHGHSSSTARRNIPLSTNDNGLAQPTAAERLRAPGASQKLTEDHVEMHLAMRDVVSEEHCQVQSRTCYTGIATELQDGSDAKWIVIPDENHNRTGSKSPSPTHEERMGDEIQEPLEDGERDVNVRPETPAVREVWYEEGPLTLEPCQDRSIGTSSFLATSKRRQCHNTLLNGVGAQFPEEPKEDS